MSGGAPAVEQGGEILFERRGRAAHVVLNRPQALNALTLGMIRALDPALAAWEADPEIAAVVIEGAGERAFCAGGDIRALYDARGGAGTIQQDFFREEYRLNRRIKRCAKPYVALLHGVTMGGGVGLSVHGGFRVATERTLFAMPETGIGMFPDVGGGYFLPRCPGRLGLYLALTGARLKAADLLHAGIATHHVPAARLAALSTALDEAVEPVAATLARFHVDPGPAPLAAQRSAIDRCFAADAVPDVLAALAADGSEWAQATAQTIARMSPFALAVSARQVEQGAHLDFEACMVMEYRLSQRFMASHDFYEGVRAVLVDKDQRPRWRPERLADVTEAMVEAAFAPLDATRELTFD